MTGRMRALPVALSTAVDESSIKRQRPRAHASSAVTILAALLLSGAGGAAAGTVDSALQKRINEAIRRGREDLLGRLRKRIDEPATDYPMGRLALPLAAALKAGAAPEHPIVEEAFRRLEDMPMKKTYSAACYLFALDARWRAYHILDTALTDETTATSLRDRSRTIRREIERAVEWLIAARGEGTGHWSYEPLPPGARRHDFSNVQFAVLGLQIGLEHGLPVPRNVIGEIARRFLTARKRDGAPREVRVKSTLSIEHALARRAAAAAEKTLHVHPAGWGYTARKDRPKASMTAAGASSLLVARNGLEGRSPRLVAQIDEALGDAYGWIAANFSDYVSDHTTYYTLYSLEKVGDLGEIESFDGKSWYREGAELLLEKQNEHGHWGSYIHTSFALLFLTRATRLKTYAPRILTRGGGAAEERPGGDYVYLSRVGGFVSAEEVLRFVAQNRRRDLVDTAAEIVRHYDPSAREELVGPLLGLWGRRPDRFTRLAREALAEITGIDSRRRESYEAWWTSWQAVKKLRDDPATTAEEVARALGETDNLRLEEALVELAHRRGFRSLAGELVGELSGAPPAYRRKLHGILVIWTGLELAAPPGDDAAAWRAVRERWETWRREESDDFSARVAARKLVDEIDRLTRSGRRLDKERAKRLERLLEDLVELGRPALPELRDALRRREFSFRLIEAFERITGKRLGLLAGK